MSRYPEQPALNFNFEHALMSAEEPAPAEKTAHWDINTDGFYPFCSRCGEAAQHMTPHCPNCGAKMITRRHGE